MSVCQIVVVGNLGRDPETRDAGSSSVCSFSVAHSRPSKESEAGAEEYRGKYTKTDWYNVDAWGKLGDVCQQYLSKGSQAVVSGQLAQRQYTTKDGDERVSLDIRATDVHFIGKREENGSGSHGSSQGSGAAASADDDIPFLCDGFPSYGEHRAHASRW